LKKFTRAIFSCSVKNNNYSPFSAEITDKFSGEETAGPLLFFDKAAASCYNPFSDGGSRSSAACAGKSYHNTQVVTYNIVFSMP